MCSVINYYYKDHNMIFDLIEHELQELPPTLLEEGSGFLFQPPPPPPPPEETMAVVAENEELLTSSGKSLLFEIGWF